MRPTDQNPYDAPRPEVGEEPSQSFAIAYLPLLKFTPLFGTIAGVITIQLTSDGGFLVAWLTNLRYVIATVAFQVVVSSVAAFGVAKAMPVTVLESGLLAYTFWGRQLFIGWHEIGQTERRNVIGYPYLCVHSTAHARTLWIPMRLQHPTEFKEALVHASAKAGHKVSLPEFDRKPSDPHQ